MIAAHRCTRPLAWTAVALVGVLGCAGDKSDQGAARDNDPMAALAGEVIEQDSHLGPVSAKIKVAPPAPTLGDPITLMLEVTAAPGVTVEMPDFGEALGRFAISRFIPRQTMRDGKWVATQIYILQAPMSGKQRIPPLRIEFVDERPGQQPSAPDPATGTGDPAAGTTGDPAAEPDPDALPGGVRELLTEEIAIQVASLLAEDLESATLSEPRGRLREPTITDSIFASAWFWIAIGVLLALGLYVVIARWLARVREQRRVDAYAAAMKRLGKLESQGLPEPENADDWYVELSGIIRRYLEDRYNLRAPELTTEEFLKIARGSGLLTVEHRKLLEQFLFRCDRVKFARYAPADDESKEALLSARSFLEDTRISAQVERAEEAAA